MSKVHQETTVDVTVKDWGPGSEPQSIRDQYDQALAGGSK